VMFDVRDAKHGTTLHVAVDGGREEEVLDPTQPLRVTGLGAGDHVVKARLLAEDGKPIASSGASASVAFGVRAK
jgi:hypothetical protein